MVDENMLFPFDVIVAFVISFPNSLALSDIFPILLTLPADEGIPIMRQLVAPEYDP
jgi:hypothetical protein